MVEPIYPDVGSSDLLSEPQAKKIKMGVINVDSDDVQQALNTALDYPMFPLTLGAKKGSLKETLFADSIGFSSVKDQVIVTMHDKWFSLKYLFNDITDDDTKQFSTVVCRDIKNAIIVFYDVETTVKIPGSSTENHKEPEDKAAVKRIMCILADNKAGAVVYSDEVEFTPQGHVTGPHGVLDLLVGIKKKSHDDMQPIVIKHDLTETEAVKVNMAETKAAHKKLTAQKVMNNPEEPNVDDLQIFAQPVMQLLAISYLFPLDQPVVLFLANRCMVRPFVYFRNYDIMLTTKIAHEWHNVEHRRLIVEGIVLMALFMQMTNIRFYPNSGRILHKRLGYPPTGFGAAIAEAKLVSAYANALLRSQKFSDKKYEHCNLPPVLHEDSPKCCNHDILDEREKEKAAVACSVHSESTSMKSFNIDTNTV